MLLTPGSLLQQDRYWIEAVLQQDDMAVSYRALHRNLDRHVVIQTLGRSLQHHPQAETLRHEFLTQVRQQSRHPDPPYRVIDCFVEGDTPFVVLDLADDLPLPPMTQWIPNLFAVMAGEAAAIAPAAVTPDSPTCLDAPLPAIGTPERQPDARYPERAAAATQQNGAAPPAIEREAVPAGASPSPSVTPSSKSSSPATSPAPAKPHVVVQTHRSRPHPGGSARRKSRWIPISLLLTAVVGGCGGAYLGWQLRQGRSFADVVPVVGPKINPEQDFPPIDDWPGQADAGADPTDAGASTPTALPDSRERRAVSEGDSAAQEEIWVEPYSIEFRPGESGVPYEPDLDFPTQETRTFPEATPDPTLESAPGVAEEDAPAAAAPVTDAPVEPVPLAPSRSEAAPPARELEDEEPKEKLEELDDFSPVAPTEERSLSPSPEAVPPSPTSSSIFLEDAVTPQ